MFKTEILENKSNTNLVVTKPNSAGLRNRYYLKKTNLSKTPFIKSSVKGKSKKSGRNNTGKITVFHKGGGNKKKYRNIVYSRKFNSSGIVTSLEYDPYRNSIIASVFDLNNNFFFYIIAPKNLSVGDIVESGINAVPKLGNSLPISSIPIGSYMYNVSSKSTKTAQFARSAGTFCFLEAKNMKRAIIRLASGERRVVSSDCYASIGIVSNEFFSLIRASKAGQSRWLNKRPTVRGVAMNPIDHPHGGGEGKKSGKGLTPWGKHVKRGKTSRSNSKFIL